MSSDVPAGLTVRDAPSTDPRVETAAGRERVAIVLDDTGFGQLGCFGSDIATPTSTRWPRGFATTASM